MKKLLTKLIETANEFILASLLFVVFGLSAVLLLNTKPISVEQNNILGVSNNGYELFKLDSYIVDQVLIKKQNENEIIFNFNNNLNGKNFEKIQIGKLKAPKDKKLQVRMEYSLPQAYLGDIDMNITVGEETLYAIKDGIYNSLMFDINPGEEKDFTIDIESDYPVYFTIESLVEIYISQF